MLTKLLTTFIVSNLFFFNIAFAQNVFSPEKNCFETKEENLKRTSTTSEINSSPIQSSLTGIPCNENIFWSIDASGFITEYQLIGTTITVTGNLYPSGVNISLAFANNTAGSAFSPTFFSAAHDSLKYFDGSSWLISSSTTGYDVFNGGGFRNIIYMTARSAGLANAIMRFDQNNFSIVYIASSGKIISIADVAVDADTNAYFLVGNFTGNTTQSDSLIVISPSGNVIKSYLFSVNTNNAYGSFIMNDIYYIGFGGSNTLYPSSLLPVTFSGNNALIGAPIPFSGSAAFADLESCSQGFPLGVNEIFNDESLFTLAPNPSADFLYLKSKISIAFPLEIFIMDLQGKLMEVKMIHNANNLILNIQSYASGTYLVRIKHKEDFLFQSIFFKQ